MGFFNLYPRAVMPGDDLLFQRLSVSTIGAVRFHGRVRDGIGWVTDAMVTKQWSRRDWESPRAFRAFVRVMCNRYLLVMAEVPHQRPPYAGLPLMVGLSMRERAIRIG